MSPFFSKRRVSFVSGALLCASLVSACSMREPVQSAAREELRPQAVAITESAPSKDSDSAPRDLSLIHISEPTRRS
ncbi:hypothetical protein D7X96_26805 [Corallococcus interemptor]|uniref:Uncharacterized protein n=1 Tax=Corallococcus interemptor TaxID=2316720 RepID=A0A3A8Q5K1_9BACT|nr:hypothetical protein [Corallococcus interemptor]RKH63959.1 hypothetical protein D7X96_26805 [Corallococcus interemptor]